MESSQTPAPPPPPPTPPATSGPEKAGVGARLGVAVLALVLLFLAAVAVIAVVDISNLTPCQDVTSLSQLDSDGQCFDGSGAKKLIVMILGWPGAILACVSVLLAVAFVIRGRGGRMLVTTIGAAVVLFGLSIIIGAI